MDHGFGCSTAPCNNICVLERRLASATARVEELEASLLDYWKSFGACPSGAGNSIGESLIIGPGGDSGAGGHQSAVERPANDGTA